MWNGRGEGGKKKFFYGISCWFLYNLPFLKLLSVRLVPRPIVKLWHPSSFLSFCQKESRQRRKEGRRLLEGIEIFLGTICCWAIAENFTSNNNENPPVIKRIWFFRPIKSKIVVQCGQIGHENKTDVQLKETQGERKKMKYQVQTQRFRSVLMHFDIVWFN